MQSFIDIPSTDSLQNSRLKLMNNDKTIMSCHSGTAFPENNLQVGMLCLRTDLNQLYQLKDLTPLWVLIADLIKTHTSKEYVDEKIDNHGNHVPTKEPFNNNRFLRNDNTWQEVKPVNIGATPSSHVGTTGAAHGVATVSLNGFMSSSDKKKLDDIQVASVKIESISIGTENWIDSTTYDDFEFQTDITLTTTLSDLYVTQVVFDPVSVIHADECYVLPSSDTVNGKIRLYSKTQPEITLNGKCIILGGI